MLLLPMLAFGSPRTEREAAQIAASVLSGGQASQHRSVSRVKTRQQYSDNDKAPYYAFNAEGGGFALISGESRAATVLAYSDEGRIDLDNMPDNLRAWLKVYEHQIGMLSQIAGDDDSGLTPDIYDTEVAPLLGRMRWDQDAPFNNYCPDYNGTYRCAAGCVAIAVAQIMAYHRWPAKGSGDAVNYTDQSQHSVSVNFADSIIDWDNILPDYLNGYNAAQASAIASLSYMVGAAHYMEYSYSSGASEYYTPYALVANFGYDDGIAVVDRNNYSASQWAQIIKDEIDSRRPVMYTGATTANEGHAFVVDGYNRQGLFHVNWGWGGVSNGYYALSALNPTVQGIGGASSLDGFNCYQDAVIAIQPAYNHDDYYYPTLGLESLTASQSTISRNGSVNIAANSIYNSDGGERAIKIALGIYDTQGRLVAISGSKDYTAYPMYPRSNTFRNATIPSTVPNGEYLLHFIYTDPGSTEWKKAICALGTPCYLPMTVTSSQIIFGTADYEPKLQLIDISATTPLYAKSLSYRQKGGFQFSVSNSNVEFLDSVQIALRKTGAENYTLIGSKIILNVPVDEQVTLPVSEYVTVSAGTYELALAVYTTGTAGPTSYLTNGTTVEVIKNAIRPTIDLNANSLNFDDNLNVYQNRAGLTLSVTNNGTDFCTDYFVYIYDASDASQSTLLQAVESQLICIAAGETAEIRLGDYLELPPGDYQAYAYYVNSSGAAIPLTPSNGASVAFTMRDGTYTALSGNSTGTPGIALDGNSITVSTTAKQELAIYNALGQKVMSGHTNQPTDVSTLAPGIYIVKTAGMTRKIIL